MSALEKARPRPPLSTVLMTVLAFLILYVPLVALVISSFWVKSVETGETAWTLQWYHSLFANSGIWDVVLRSLWIGFFSTLISTVIGTMASLALERSYFRGKKAFSLLTMIPLVTPEIVLGLSMLIWFVFLRITLGTLSIVLAHITFSVSYVIVTVGARLVDFDLSVEEAAQDLGASRWQTFWRITFPLIWPGILSGALMAFTLSFDDFLITFFTAGVGSDTLPLRLYSMIKFGVSPEINALSTLIIAATLLIVGVFFSQKSFKIPNH